MGYAGTDPSVYPAFPFEVGTSANPKPGASSGGVLNECSLENTAPRPEPDTDPEPGATTAGVPLRDGVISGCRRNDSIENFGGDDTIRGDSGNARSRAGAATTAPTAGLVATPAPPTVATTVNSCQ